MSMMAKDRFAIATGRQWVAGSSDGVGRYLLAGRDGRLFIIFLGGVSGQLVLALWYIGVASALLLMWRMLQMWSQSRPTGAIPATAGTPRRKVDVIAK
jgi:hypothetical protein